METSFAWTVNIYKQPNNSLPRSTVVHINQLASYLVKVPSQEETRSKLQRNKTWCSIAEGGRPLGSGLPHSIINLASYNTRNLCRKPLSLV